MQPDDFLGAHPDPRPWSMSDGELDVGAEAAGTAAVEPDQLFLGRGQHPLEVATARAAGRPQASIIRSVWRRRQRNRPSPLLLVVMYPQDGGHRAAVCGPAGDEPPVRTNLELNQVERLCAAALAEPSRHNAVRLLTATLPEVESELPGVHNSGTFATHELREGVPLRAAQRLLGQRVSNPRREKFPSRVAGGITRLCRLCLPGPRGIGITRPVASAYLALGASASRALSPLPTWP